jgi:hypothetical protein
MHRLFRKHPTCEPICLWKFLDIDVYVDKNGDFKRAIGISEAPFTILFDQQMRFYCRHSGHCGNIDELVCQKVNE